MRRNDAGAMTALMGGFALWMGLTPTHLLYVKPSMARWLVLSGAVLVVVGLLVIVLGRRAGAIDAATARGDGTSPADRHGRSDPEGHAAHHHHATRVGWLLALPLCVAIAVGSNPLGSYAAGRQNSQRVLPPGHFDLEQYLVANSFGGQSPALRSIDFVRASQDPHDRGLLARHPVKLTGFVVEDPDGHGHSFLLTRFMIGCCAADALAVQELVPVEHGHVPDEDSWVEVEATLDLDRSPPAGQSLDPPVLAVRSIHPVSQPEELYEYP